MAHDSLEEQRGHWGQRHCGSWVPVPGLMDRICGQYASGIYGAGVEICPFERLSHCLSFRGGEPVASRAYRHLGGCRTIGENQAE